MNLQSSFQEESSYLFCGNSYESLHRLVFSCSFARLIWRLSSWGLNVEFFQHSSIENWIKCILDPSKFFGIPTSDAHSFQLFAVLILDSLWMARNKALHENSRAEPLSLFQQILRLHKELLAA